MSSTNLRAMSEDSREIAGQTGPTNLRAASEGPREIVVEIWTLTATWSLVWHGTTAVVELCAVGPWTPTDGTDVTRCLG